LSKKLSSIQNHKQSHKQQPTGAKANYSIHRSSQNSNVSWSVAHLPMPIAALICLLAGAMLPLAFAPYQFWPVAFISPALLYLLLNQRSPMQAFLLGEAYGFGLWSVGAFWLFTSIHQYGDTSTPIALLMIVFVALMMGLFNAVGAWAYRRFLPESPLTFAPLWVLIEWLKTWLFTGFPWLFVGYAMIGRGLDGYAPVAGVFAVTGAVVLIGCAMIEIFRRRLFWILPILVVIGVGIGLNQFRFTTLKEAPALSVSLIQGNIPQNLKWLTEYRQKTMQIYENLSKNEWGRDLIVWPESSIPMFQSDPEAVPIILKTNNTAVAHHSAWVTGIPYIDYNPAAVQPNGDAPFYNAIGALGDDASGLYKKQRLVPFGEYIPFPDIFYWVLPSLRATGSFSAGSKGQTPLEIRGHALASAICYEIAYPNLTRLNARNSDFLITISNDAWFGTSDGPLQHLQMVQMRSKETGRWFIRATNTGVTAFINDQGEIVKRTAQFKAEVLRGNLPAMVGETPYMRWGDLPILLLSGLLILMGFWVKLRYQR
jgi:apolipoprotein N-acyltransferase